MVQTIFQQTNDLLWTALIIVWIIGFFGNKPTVKSEPVKNRLLVSVLLIIGFSLVFSDASVGGWIGAPLPSGPLMQPFGVIVTALGVAFAVWARFTLGKNWSGALITAKQGHELVTRGPYALVRHPIYTGFLLAALGTLIINDTFGSLLGFGLIAIAFFLRIPREEALMTELFPADYPAYKKRTKMIVPFLF